MSRRQDELEFVAILTREAPHLTGYQLASYAVSLIRWARRHTHVCERYCNGEYSSDAHYDRALDLTEQALWRLAKNLGDGDAAHFRVTFRHDPRGATVVLNVPSGSVVCIPIW